MTEEKAQYYSDVEDDEMDSIHEDLNIRVREEGIWKAYWMMPNIVNDMDISREAFRLYSNLKRVCGESGASWQSTETLAIYCGMGEGTVSRAKQELQNYVIPLIKVEKKGKRGGGIYHDITILDIWDINIRYSKGLLGIKFKKVMKYEALRKRKQLEKLGRITDESDRSSSVESRQAERSSSVETKNTTINNTTYLPSQKKCEGGHGDNEMCDKCNYLEQKIKVGEEYGFDLDTANTKVQLQELKDNHKNGVITATDTKTSEQRRVDILQNTGDEYSSIIADYPENMQKPLRMFVETFKMSPFAIPKKSKSKGGNYAVWINGINELVTICKGDLKRYKLVLDRTYATWYTRSSEFRNNIDMPQKIKAQFITEDSGLSIDQEKKEIEFKKITPKVEESEYVTPDEMAKLMKGK